MKTFKFALAALGAVAGLVTTAQAAELAAYRGRPVDLGAVAGVAYYTVEQGGYRVVATLAEADSDAAVRFEAVLAPGQSVVLSSPAVRGGHPARVEISRIGERIEVASSPVTN